MPESPLLIDITRTIRHGMPTWPGEPGPELTPVKSIAKGDPANVAKLCLGLHTGTHVDAPRHFFDGAAGVETVPVAKLCGRAVVIPISDRSVIDVPELSRLGLDAMDGGRRVLFKTRNSAVPFDIFRKDFVAVTPEAAKWLTENSVVLVGVDGPSVEKFGGDGTTHRTLLEAGVVIVENLDLGAAPPGDYELWCLPAKVAGGDGAPARAVLMPLGERP